MERRFKARLYLKKKPPIRKNDSSKKIIPIKRKSFLPSDTNKLSPLRGKLDLFFFIREESKFCIKNKFTKPLITQYKISFVLTNFFAAKLQINILHLKISPKNGVVNNV